MVIDISGKAAWQARICDAACKEERELKRL